MLQLRYRSRFDEGEVRPKPNEALRSNNPLTCAPVKQLPKVLLLRVHY